MPCRSVRIRWLLLVESARFWSHTHHDGPVEKTVEICDDGIGKNPVTVSPIS